MLKFLNKVKGKYVMRKVLLLIVALLFLNGCAPRIYIHSQADPDYNFLPAKRKPDDSFLNLSTIFIFPFKNLTLTEKKFRNLLVTELTKQNFRIFQIGEVAGVLPDLIISFVLGEKTGQVDTYITLPDWKTISGNIGDTTFKATEYGTKDIPYSYTIRRQGISLFVYDAKAFINGETTPIWEGFIFADKKDYNKFPELCVRKLLEYYGKDFEGRIPIDIYSK